MIIYKEYIEVQGTQLTLTLPDNCIGKKVEVFVKEADEIRNKEQIENFIRILEPHSIKLDKPDTVFRREEMYD